MNGEKQKTTPKGANYLGLTFQMGAFIFLATFGGLKLDEKLGDNHFFVIIFSLLSIAISMYYIVHKLTYKKKKDE